MATRAMNFSRVSILYLWPSAFARYSLALFLTHVFCSVYVIDSTTRDSFRRMKSKISNRQALFCHSFDIIDFENLLHGLHIVKKRKIRASRRRHWRHELVFMKLTILHYLSTRFSLANGVKK